MDRNMNNTDRNTASVIDPITAAIKRRVLAELVTDQDFNEHVDRLVEQQIADMSARADRTTIPTKIGEAVTSVAQPNSENSAPRQPKSAPTGIKVKAKTNRVAYYPTSRGDHMLRRQSAPTLEQAINAQPQPEQEAEQKTTTQSVRPDVLSDDRSRRIRGLLNLFWLQPYFPGPKTPKKFANLAAKHKLTLELGIALETAIYTNKEDTLQQQVAQGIRYSDTSGVCRLFSHRANVEQLRNFVEDFVDGRVTLSENAPAMSLLRTARACR
jgi:hypothetical protein